MSFQVDQIVFGPHGRGMVLEVRSYYYRYHVRYDCGYEDGYDEGSLSSEPRWTCGCVERRELIRSFFPSGYDRICHIPTPLDQLRVALELVSQSPNPSPQLLQSLIR